MLTKMSPPMFPTVLYLLCARMIVWGADDNVDNNIIYDVEETFKKFRDEKSQTDHYRLVNSALQVFHQCDLDYQASESVAKFGSLSFVDQIDLVIEALVTIHLLPRGLVNPIKKRTMTEADFHTRYQAWAQGFKDNSFSKRFAPKSFKCEFLKYFLVNVFTTTEQSDIHKYSTLLNEFRTGFYETFEVQATYKAEAQAPTWKLPRWQTVAIYVGAGTVVGALIAGGMYFWPIDSTTRTMENVSNNFSAQANFTSGFTGGVGGVTLAESGLWTIVIIIIMIILVAIVAAFVVYLLMPSSSNNSLAQSKLRTTDCKNSSTGSTETTATTVLH